MRGVENTREEDEEEEVEEINKIEIRSFVVGGLREVRCRKPKLKRQRKTPEEARDVEKRTRRMLFVRCSSRSGGAGGEGKMENFNLRNIKIKEFVLLSALRGGS